MGVFTGTHPIAFQKDIVGESNKIVVGDFPGSPVVRFHLFFQCGGKGLNPVRELRSHMPSSIAKKLKKKKKG